MQKLRIQFFNYFHIYLFVIFVFCDFIIFILFYYFIFLLFLLCKMQKIAGHNISPFFEDFGPQSLKKILVCKNRYRHYIQCDGNQKKILDFKVQEDSFEK